MRISRPLFEYCISILSVWVDHFICIKVCFDSINKLNKHGTKTRTKKKMAKKQNTTKTKIKVQRCKKTKTSKKGEKPGGPVMGRLLCTLLVWVWLIASVSCSCVFFIFWFVCIQPEGLDVKISSNTPPQYNENNLKCIE